MDYNLAALKLLCSHLNAVRKATSHQNANTLGPILFQRAWLQGVLVTKPSLFEKGVKVILDDGTGTVDLYLSNDFLAREWEIGMYVMVVGRYFERSSEPRFIHVHKIVDLSGIPDREPMWYLEVVEAFRLFYQPLLEQ